MQLEKGRQQKCHHETEALNPNPAKEMKWLNGGLRLSAPQQWWYPESFEVSRVAETANTEDVERSVVLSQ